MKDRMKEVYLSDEYISSFCHEMSLLLHAGVNLADGLHLLAEDESDRERKEVLEYLGQRLDQGTFLSNALKDTQNFPGYLVKMVETGELTGRQEQAFESLAEYYETRHQLKKQIRNAIGYPLILATLMMIIILVLLVRVLPVFHKVYEQLGGSMRGIAGGFLQLGRWIGNIMPVLCIVLVCLLLITAVLYWNHKFRKKVFQSVTRWFQGHGIFRKVTTAQFAAAFSMGMMSGLSIEEAFKNASSIYNDSPSEKLRYGQCLEKLEDGMGLAQALREERILSRRDCRLLELGIKCGSGDTVMSEIARKLREDAEQSLEERIGVIEPAIVITMSIIIGTILISVMLPLMNIMSSIG